MAPQKEVPPREIWWQHRLCSAALTPFPVRVAWVIPGPSLCPLCMLDPVFQKWEEEEREEETDRPSRPL